MYCAERLTILLENAFLVKLTAWNHALAQTPLGTNFFFTIYEP